MGALVPALVLVLAAQAARTATIPLAPYVGPLRSVVVHVGGQPHPFIMDTGGGETMVTPELASVIGCKPYGRAIGLRAGGEQVAFQYCDDVRLQIGPVTIPHERLGVFDLKSVLPPGVPAADGVVSLRSFRRQPITLDMHAGTITVETAASLRARTARMRPLTIRIATGPTGAETTVYVRGRIGGERVWLLLDSGNGDPLLVAEHVANAAGLATKEGELLVDLDGVGPIRLPGRPSRIIYDGVLGAAFLEQWIITFDLNASRAWIAPARH